MVVVYVCDVIKNINSEVNTYIDGYAASTGSLISVCGNNRFISKNSHVLIHQLSTSQSGKAAELGDEYINVKSFMNNLRNIYMENTKLSEEQLDKLLLRFMFELYYSIRIWFS
jgi:ATP-dependent protease ClpP protease subunit